MMCIAICFFDLKLFYLVDVREASFSYKKDEHSYKCNYELPIIGTTKGAKGN